MRKFAQAAIELISGHDRPTVWLKALLFNGIIFAVFLAAQCQSEAPLAGG